MLMVGVVVVVGMDHKRRKWGWGRYCDGGWGVGVGGCLLVDFSFVNRGDLCEACIA